MTKWKPYAALAAAAGAVVLLAASLAQAERDPDGRIGAKVFAGFRSPSEGGKRPGSAADLDRYVIEPIETATKLYQQHTLNIQRHRLH